VLRTVWDIPSDQVLKGASRKRENDGGTSHSESSESASGKLATRRLQARLLSHTCTVRDKQHCAQAYQSRSVQVLARSRLGISSLVDTDKPGALSARNNLPLFAGHASPPASNRACTRHPGCRENQNSLVIERGDVAPAVCLATISCQHIICAEKLSYQCLRPR
jgi:hypothetical protein